MTTTILQCLTINGTFTEQDAKEHIIRLQQHGCTSLSILQTLTENELKDKYGFNKNLVIRGILKAIEESKHITTTTTTNNNNTQQQQQHQLETTTTTPPTGLKSSHFPFSTGKDPPPCDILANHEEGINGVAFSYDNVYLYSVSDDHTIGVWDVNTATLVKKLSHHFAIVSCIATSPISHIFVTGDRRGGVIFWNGDEETFNCGKFSPRKITMKHSSSVTSITFSSDGRLVMSTSMIQNKALVWYAETGEMIGNDLGLSGGVSVISIPLVNSPASFFLTIDTSKCLIHYCLCGGVETFTHSHVIPGFNAGSALALMRDGERVAIVGDSGNLQLYQIIKTTNKPASELQASDFRLQLIKRVQGHNKKSIYSVAASWTLIATGASDSSVHIWCAYENGDIECLNILTSKYSAPIYGLAFTRDGQMLASGSTDSSVKFYLA